MRIAYLYEKKSHENSDYNQFGWSYWEFKYAIDYKDYKKKPRKHVKYRAYFQGDDYDCINNRYERWNLFIRRDVNFDKTVSKTMVDREYKNETKRNDKNPRVL